MKEISPNSLKEMMNKKTDFQLIDVREYFEHEICCIGGDKIDMYSIMNNIDKISKKKDVIFYCRTGNRSEIIIKMIEKKYPFNNLYNLEGGIMRWREDVDNSINKY